MTERVVLAYSGGLDTSVGIGWLRDATGKEVVALAVDVGQGGERLGAPVGVVAFGGQDVGVAVDDHARL